VTNHFSNHRFEHLAQAAEAARNGAPLPVQPVPPPQQQMPPLNMQILHAGVAIANMGVMEGLPDLGGQIDRWEAAVALAPPNPADVQVCAVGRVLARAQAELRTILKRSQPAVTSEADKIPDFDTPDRPPQGLRLLEDEPPANGHAAEPAT